MFTGIVTAVGRVERADRDERGLTLRISAPYDGVAVGESIAVDGACLTVETVAPGAFTVHVVATSLGRTAFGAMQAGRRVNLERALAVGERLGGHLVSGHVDGVGTVTRTAAEGDAWLVEFTLPAEVAAVTIPLGSITVQGVSLTVNALPAPGTCQVSLIPHTRAVTTLGGLAVGDAVHLEGDMVGKYVRQFVAPWQGR
ncbi:MAG TPA: riboflavin synthase [Gemmatimonadales bacterium]|jgi:riboflavin synthase|nr:riboflavin synthase [Gemmatimonadales bacterium]